MLKKTRKMKTLPFSTPCIADVLIAAGVDQYIYTKRLLRFYKIIQIINLCSLELWVLIEALFRRKIATHSTR